MGEIRQAVRASASILSALSVVAGGALFLLSSCGSESATPNPAPSASPSPSPSPSPSASLTYNDVKSIVTSNCKSCHAEYDSESGLKTGATKILERIALPGSNTLSMPQGRGSSAAAYDTTTDGKKLKEYLTSVK